MNSTIKIKQFEILQNELPNFPQTWTEEEVINWLNLIGMSQYIENFKEMKIDGLIILDLDENDLKTELLIKKKLHLKKIMKGLEILKEYENFLILLEDKKIKNKEILVENKKIEIEESFDEITSKSELTARDEGNDKIKKKKVINSDYIIIKSLENPSNFEYVINNEIVTIGRHSSNNIVIFDEIISRHHAKVIKKKKGFYLKDCGSTIGTFLKIREPIKIEKNMIFEIGSYQFKITNLFVKESTDFENKILDSFVEFSCYLKLDNNNSENSEIEENFFFKLQSGETIGRKLNNTINFESDLHLSNIHCKINLIEDHFYFEDIKSTNGSWLRFSDEQKKSKKFLLKNNDIFKIGNNSIYEVSLKSTKRKKKEEEKFIEKEEKIEKEEYIEKEEFIVKEEFECFLNFESNIEEKDDFCKLCKDTEKNCLIMPCKHNVACMECCDKLDKCPLCGVRILEIMKIFKS